MNLSVKEKEKYVLQLREAGKTYRDIAHELRMSPREISRVLKKANGEMEAKERKKIILSNTAIALQLFKKGKSPTEVAIKLDMSPEEAQSLYFKYLSLNNLHHFVETFEEFDNDSLQDLINYYDYIKENGIGKEEVVEAINISNDYSKIKEEYDDISNQLRDFRRERDFYLSDNEFLRSKNCELNNECNSLLSKIESQSKLLKLTENKLNKKRELLKTTENSEDHTTLKNRIEEQVNDFLDQKTELLKLAVMTVLNIMKQDPEREVLINNILNPNENPDSGFYLISYEEKLADIVVDTLSDIALEINTNNILHS